jgi:hypothetical protein
MLVSGSKGGRLVNKKTRKAFATYTKAVAKNGAESNTAKLLREQQGRNEEFRKLADLANLAFENYAPKKRSKRGRAMA